MPEYIYPKSVEEVTTHLKSSSLLYAGGTALYKRNLKNYKYIVDLNCLDLCFIVKNREDLVFDTMVTVQDIIESDDVPSILKEMCRTVGSTPLRSLITVGGELHQCPYWAHLPVYFHAVDAIMECYDNQGNLKSMNCRSFLGDHSKFKHYFIFRIQVPVHFLKYTGTFFNFTETSFDYSILNYLILQNPENKKDTRITLGGIQRFPLSFSTLEDKIQDKGYLTQDDVESACYDVLSAFRNDIRFSAHYRCEVLKNQLLEDLKRLEIVQ